MRRDQGFGLVELLIAMTVMAVALMALVAAFSSSSFAVARASNVATAGALADTQMEAYRIMSYDDIGLDLTNVASLDATYKNDTACYDVGTATNCTQSTSPAGVKLIAPTGAHTCATINLWYPTTVPCTPQRVVVGADGHSYRIDTYIAATATTAAMRTTKHVVVVVRDATNLGSTLAREDSVFDCSTGALGSTCPVA